MRTCSSCFQNDLKNLECGIGDDAHEIHEVLICNCCNIYWNRDVMAAKNMFAIAESTWNGHGRPPIFTRQCATSNVVAEP
ncbi:hypothetical protein MFLAVUS_000532 [Mucor flavus]|uniref:Uncharacterized protein n=1 Tax=Mucor flavus TaxID=439312 RepID=A0ABP9YJY9_9FUNG